VGRVIEQFDGPEDVTFVNVRNSHAEIVGKLADSRANRLGGDPPTLLPGLTFHALRHTYATLALNSGVEPKIVSDRVGHSNPGITFQITLTGRPDSTDRPQTSPEA